MKQVASSMKLFNGKVPVLATSSLDTDLVMFLEDALFVLGRCLWQQSMLE